MRVKIEHRLGIRAPAEAIWSVIADIDAWPQWNPLYPKAEGTLRIGGPLTLEVALPGQAPRALRPVIVDWVPNEQILWRLSLLGGLIRSTRFLEIEKLADSASIFSNGEMFEGLLGPGAGRRLRGALRAGFAAMGEAVKERVEARWRADNSDPI